MRQEAQQIRAREVSVHGAGPGSLCVSTHGATRGRPNTAPSERGLRRRPSTGSPPLGGLRALQRGGGAGPRAAALPPARAPGLARGAKTHAAHCKRLSKYSTRARPLAMAAPASGLPGRRGRRREPLGPARPGPARPRGREGAQARRAPGSAAPAARAEPGSNNFRIRALAGEFSILAGKCHSYLTK